MSDREVLPRHNAVDYGSYPTYHNHDDDRSRRNPYVQEVEAPGLTAIFADLSILCYRYEDRSLLNVDRAADPFSIPRGGGFGMDDRRHGDGDSSSRALDGRWIRSRPTQGYEDVFDQPDQRRRANQGDSGRDIDMHPLSSGSSLNPRAAEYMPVDGRSRRHPQTDNIIRNHSKPKTRGGCVAFGGYSDDFEDNNPTSYNGYGEGAARYGGGGMGGGRRGAVDRGGSRRHEVFERDHPFRQRGVRDLVDSEMAGVSPALGSLEETMEDTKRRFG